MSRIAVRIVQDSSFSRLWLRPARVTTFVLEYPRIVHAELMTHRVFSRNSSSSRAIPIEAVIEQTCKNPVIPLHIGANQPGMVADEELSPMDKAQAIAIWKQHAKDSRKAARRLAKLGVHKQVANRVLEAHQHMKVVLTGTDFDNFFALRTDKGADPHIRELAKQMWVAYQHSQPMTLKRGEWHLPFIERNRVGSLLVYRSEGRVLSEEEALMVSASACAQVSYRKEDLSLDKAQRIFARLAGSRPIHASPFEHQAQPLFLPTSRCRNFRGWRQLRTLIPNDTITEFKEVA